ncbi:hypothetical protein SAMN04487943_101595 [Gracilibacillus orientalis]|uniref:Uncharacterized protein n=1 Tax=Gracilibacillus orientalis TaxID=334253 RepID=A0A1I4HSD4_9BACI|nr:hypothetical protein [Gracilibacillus orientalis]SFL44693.1 hypothetical protein SAMN04487943_101595 [Gracilibacillus orientalis]
MEMPIGLFIFLCVVSLIIFYAVIETAVRRGIDSSQTSQMIKELLDKQNEKDDK